MNRTLVSSPIEWSKTWAWWSHEVWVEIYFYDWAFEAAWMKIEKER